MARKIIGAGMECPVGRALVARRARAVIDAVLLENSADARRWAARGASNERCIGAGHVLAYT